MGQAERSSTSGFAAVLVGPHSLVPPYGRKLIGPAPTGRSRATLLTWKDSCDSDHNRSQAGKVPVILSAAKDLTWE